MKKLLLTLAFLSAVSFSFAGDDKPAGDKACCKEGSSCCCKDKAHPKDCQCEKCKAAGEKKTEEAEK